jgi:hypothetical protein
MNGKKRGKNEDGRTSAKHSRQTDPIARAVFVVSRVSFLHLLTDPSSYLHQSSSLFPSALVFFLITSAYMVSYLPPSHIIPRQTSSFDVSERPSPRVSCIFPSEETGNQSINQFSFYCEYRQKTLLSSREKKYLHSSKYTQGLNLWETGNQLAPHAQIHAR